MTVRAFVANADTEVRIFDPRVEERRKPSSRAAFGVYCGAKICAAPLEVSAMSLTPPIDLQRWIEEHRHLLKPPVGNKCIVDGDFIIMIVGGPNARSDYHWDEGPEFFHQLEGEMLLRVQDDGARRDIPIRAGEVFYLPPRMPHSPQRMPDSIGLVIERRRLPHEQDGLLWFCERCNHKLYEEFFALQNIETDFPAVFERYYRSLDARTCKTCGHVDAVPEKYR